MNKVCLILLVSLACVLAIGNECNPDGDGKPICSAENAGQPSRNFWDPTAYWWCASAKDEAEPRRCPSSSLYDSATQECIAASKWRWTPPCPQYY